MNYSHSEIEKFDQFAQDWWNPNGPMKPLHQLNPVRLDYIQRYSPLSQQHIIDVGCGVGLLSESLARAGAIVTGIDMSEQALDVATAHAKAQHIQVTYKKTTVEEQATLTPSYWDVVTCMELLEHVPDPVSVITACATITKPNGFVFFSTINRTLQAYLTAILGAEYVLQLLPKGTHDYKQFIRPSELDRACRQAGLTLVNLSGLNYHPIKQIFELSTHVTVNYICCYRKAL